jgi:hypothetical protein
MQPLNLQINFADQSTKTVAAIAADFIAFETHFDKPFTVVSTDQRLTYLFYIGWAVMKRTNLTDLDFEKWSETVIMVGVADDPKASEA